jgi:hypothetical protein
MAFSQNIQYGVLVQTWDALDGSDNGDAAMHEGFTDRTVHVTGTFDSATVTIQGSNDGTNWATLNDVAGAPLTFTAAGMRTIREAPYYTRAITSGGGGTTDVNVVIVGAM